MSEAEGMPSDTYLPVICRPAVPDDTPAVMELTARIWDGDDYIPYVWQEWLEDPDGQLAVAEYEGKIVGIGKLTLVVEAQWWFEGLRTHPDYQGRGTARQMHHYLLQVWEQKGGVVRLTTHSHRIAVHKLCAATGFTKRIEVTTYAGNPLPGPADRVQPVEPGDVARAIDFIRLAPSMEITEGLVDCAWKWVEPVESLLHDQVTKGMAWWWEKDKGIFTAVLDEWEDNKDFLISILACRFEDITTMLQSCLHIALELGCKRASLKAPPHAEEMLAEAGFRRDWNESLYIYERKQQE